MRIKKEVYGMIYRQERIVTASDTDGTVRLGTYQTFAMLQDGMFLLTVLWGKVMI